MLHRGGCCCCKYDCTDCAAECNNNGSILATVSYTPCGGAVDCAGLSGGVDGVLTWEGACDWSTDGIGGHDAGDFGVRIHCEDEGGGVKRWWMDVFHLEPDPVVTCRSWDNIVCVVCLDGRPTGVFVVPIFDEGIAGACGSATVTLTTP